MGTHLIPREPDGESRILYIFTNKGFLGLLIGLVPGSILYSLFSAFGANVVGWVALVLCALVGVVIGQFKMPESRAFDLLRKTGGEYIRNVIINYFKFNKNRKYYVYDSEACKSKEIIDNN